MRGSHRVIRLIARSWLVKIDEMLYNGDPSDDRASAMDLVRQIVRFRDCGAAVGSGSSDRSQSKYLARTTCQKGQPWAQVG